MKNTSLVLLVGITLWNICSISARIVIPLEVHSYNEGGYVASALKSTNIDLRNNDGLYYTAILTMGTPPQKIKFIFDSGIGLLWVTSFKFCVKSKTKCKNHKFYTSANSMSYEGDGKEFAYVFDQQRYIEGIIGQETFKIGQLTVPEQDFVEATDLDDITRDSLYDGAIGLSFVTEGGTAHTDMDPLLINMAQNNIIESAVFAFYYSRIGGPVHSELSLGEVDKTKFTGTPVTTPVISNDHWVISVDKITVGKKVVADPTPVAIRSGTRGMKGPANVALTILTAIGATKNPADGLYYIDCGRLGSTPSITFYVNSQPFILQPQDYIITFDDVDSGMYCWAGIQPVLDLNVFVLGATFLRRYYTMFDMDHRQISIARSI